MSKIIMQKIMIFLASTLSILALFFLMVFLQNDNIMIATISNPTVKNVKPHIYFTSEGKAYTQENSRSPFKVKGNNYYFSLPELKTIQYARFDPTTRKLDLNIQKITFISSHWFHTSIYELSTDKLTPLRQVEGYKKTANGINFSTTGKDPQLNVAFSLKLISSAKNKHLVLLITSILSFIILFFLYKLYKTEELNDALLAKLILYSLFFAFALFKVDYYKENIKKFYPPDEIAHLSYIDYVHHHDELIPKFENMMMINNKKSYNYLNHPPLYYKIMDIVYDKNYSVTGNFDNFRSMSMLLFITSFLLLLYLGFSSNISLLAHFVYLTFISSIPMYAYLGGSISNDTLAILGGVIFIIGLKRIIENRYNNLTYFILGFGIFIAYFGKLTAAILIFFALLYFFIYALKTKVNFKITKMQMGMLILFLLPIIYYQLHIMLTYHSIMPSFNITHPEEYLKSGFFIPENYRQYLSPLQWGERMWHYIQGGWFGIHSHHSFSKSSILGYIGLFILHIFAIATFFLKCKDDSRSYCFIGKIGLLALFSVLVVQYIFSYKTHMNSGYMGGLQPRYLLPFMFSFAIMASIFVNRYKQLFLFNIFVILICIHTIYSDFFYFLNYYL